MGIEFVQDFTVVLLVAGISGAICRRLGASATIGYLLA
jgi:Kef-type K+ transport system membrane component KefB